MSTGFYLTSITWLVIFITADLNKYNPIIVVLSSQ